MVRQSLGNSPLLSLPPISKSSKRKRRRRSVSVFTTASVDSLQCRRNDELDAVKTATLKLLDTAYEDEIIVLQADPLPPSIEVINKSENPKLDFQKTMDTSINESHDVDEAKNLIQSSSNSHLDQCKTSVQLSDPSCKASSSQIHKSQDNGFQVSREEVFCDDAISKAFNAFMAEFQAFNQNVENCQASSQLPRSKAEKRKISALYYGMPPPPPPHRNKKSRPRIFLSPLVPIANNLKETKKPTPRQASSSESDLDLEEYREMFGLSSPLNDSDEDLQESDDHEVNGQSIHDSLKKTGTTSELPQNIPVETDQESSQDMICSSSSQLSDKEKNSPKSSYSITQATKPLGASPDVESPKVKDFCNGTTCDSSTSASNLTKIASKKTSPSTEDYLTPSQKLHLSNAMRAQYWAGYYTGIFNQSIGIQSEMPKFENHKPQDPQSSSDQPSDGMAI
ncbi:hypothetical protein BY996DRAFT_7044597 [Phakopsora pachyrhizi]|uniref:Expressed protein n=1 Tax=Phakopsora pachyrhizi TaxID=170000 RepID=A0AAV0BNJ1_PHAPC|nr:hypothetical protein BY996DRAFT_7044597 [Phakopsora pachyrhizi]CAH7687938.1 expressed protein [Phakopsora pachyrhizi]